MIEAVRSIPGVTAAGTVNRVPFTGGLRGVPIFQPGTTEFTLNNSVLAPYVFTISPGYLEAAGTRLLGGRDFSWRDTTQTPYVAIVNETFARKMWGDTPAIGQRFHRTGPLDRSRGRGGGRQIPRRCKSRRSQWCICRCRKTSRTNMIFVARSQRAQNEMAAALERTLNGLEPDARITVQSWLEVLRAECAVPGPGGKQ